MIRTFVGHMKIALDARFYNRETAGLGRYTHQLILNLSKIDKKNQYLVFLMKKDLADFKKNIKAKNFKSISVNFNHYSLAEQIRFPQELKKYRFDFIHFLNFNHPIFYRLPFITTIHDLTLYFFPSRSKKDFLHQLAFRRIMKDAIKKSKMLIAASNRTKKDIIGLFNKNKDQIQVIYEGGVDGYKKLSEKQINDFKHKNDLKKPYLLYVGQWRPHKNLVRLVYAFKILKDKYGFDGKLVLPGKEIPTWRDVSKTIKKLELENDIIRPGFIDEKNLVYWYNGAEVFVFPSLQEGFGIPPLEAMASGTPVVAAEASCIPEVLGNAAYYFDPYSIDDMAKAIGKVLTDNNLKNNLIKAGFKQIKKYSWKNMAKQTLKSYGEVGKKLTNR